MKYLDILQLSTRIFKVNKLRTFLTILGIGIGIGAILFLVSLGYGIQKIVLERIASSDALLSLDITEGNTEDLTLNHELIEELIADKRIAEVSPLVNLRAVIDTGKLTSSVEVQFVRDSFVRLSGIEVDRGSFFKEDEVDKIIISTAAMKLLGITESDLDKGLNNVHVTLLLPRDQKDEESSINNGMTGNEYNFKELKTVFSIAGVVKSDIAPFIFVNYGNISDLGAVNISQLKIKATNNKALKDIRESMINIGYGASAISDTIEQANKIFTIIQITLGVFGIIAMFVSAIGMFNTMTISLLQRTKEIGIMKSIGAKNIDIKKMFLIESFMIGVCGGLIGLAIGFFLEYVFNLLLNLLSSAFGGTALNIFYTPGWFIVLIIIFSTVVGLLTGVWPARRASRLNALDALKYN